MTELDEPDDHRVDVRPERVVAELDEDVAPGVEGRLEVDERDVERALVDLVRRLERGHDQPVDREQDDERPANSRSDERRRTSAGGRRGPSVTDRGARNGLPHATVRHPAPDEADVDRRDDRHEDQQQVGDRRRPAEVERVPVDVGLERHRLGGRARAAAEQDVRHVDDLEALDQPDEDDRRRRPAGCAGIVMWRKLCQRLGAVDEGRLADLLVEALERGQQDDEHERRPLPRVADDHRDPGQPRVGDPGEVAQAERRPRAARAGPSTCRSSSGTCSRRRPA